MEHDSGSVVRRQGDVLEQDGRLWRVLGVETRRPPDGIVSVLRVEPA